MRGQRRARSKNRPKTTSQRAVTLIGWIIRGRFFERLNPLRAALRTRSFVDEARDTATAMDAFEHTLGDWPPAGRAGVTLACEPALWAAIRPVADFQFSNGDAMPSRINPERARQSNGKWSDPVPSPLRSIGLIESRVEEPSSIDGDDQMATPHPRRCSASLPGTAP